jgi:hypothetical protein
LRREQQRDPEPALNLSCSLSSTASNMANTIWVLLEITKMLTVLRSAFQNRSSCRSVR